MIDSFSSFMIAIKDLLEAIQKQKNVQEQRLDVALETIVEAIAETRKYIERDNSNERSRDKELELYKLWQQAAIKVRRVDSNLAERLEVKSLYWKDAMRLPRKEILEKGIALRQVEDEFKKLFSRK
jgi:hypothetical protein